MLAADLLAGLDESLPPHAVSYTHLDVYKRQLILGVSFILGFAITIAEPDLQVLAETVPHIDSTLLLAVVGAGVGLFMSVCMLRIMYGVRLRWVLLGSYAVVFLLASLTDPRFLSIAFDSGGVTTGPMTVPFILAPVSYTHLDVYKRQR